MMYLSCLSLILAIYQFSKPIQCAYVNISMSSMNVKLNESILITLTDMNPVCCEDLDSLDLFGTRLGTATRIAHYNRRNVFVVPTVPDAAYKDRVYMSGGNNVTISPVTVADEKTKYYFIYNYYFPSGASVATPVESKKLELQNVYAFPVIHSTPLKSGTTAIEGTPEVITCAIKSRPQTNFTWTHDVDVTGIQTQNVIEEGGYFITTGKFNITQPSSLMDGKAISCTGTPMFGSTINQSTTLTVLYRPKNTLLTINPTLLTLNSNVQLTCSATGKPNVTNYKFFINGRLVGNTSDGKLTLTASNCANFTGTYTCVPESSIGEGEKKSMMKEFNGTITFTTILSSKSIDKGQNETLTCSATGCPVPTIRWTKDGANLTQTGNTLTLYTVTKSDAGSYACHASNGNDSKSADMTLTVNYKPDMVNFTTPMLKPMNGHPVVFTCNSNGLPAPSYRIHRINGTNDTVVQDNSSSTYTIPSINYADYIDYKVTFKCVPYNRLGNGPSKNHTLDIQVPPRTSLTMTPNTIREFGNATLSCVVSAANPPATITLRNPGNSSITHSNGVAALTNVTRQGHGIYTCIANNIVGSSATKAAVLIVEYKPDDTTFSSSPSSNPVHGQLLTLNCSSNGIPAPSYRIQSTTGGNNTKVLSNTTSGTHIISKINYADYVDFKVTFRCVPHNIIGSGPSKGINLEVQVQPILVISSNQTVKEGDNVTFTCSITVANPAPNITWKDPSNSVIGHINGTITLNSIKRDQAGSYSCHADNAVVEAVMKTTHVVVQHAPVESKLSAAHKDVIENGTVTLTCAAVAVPAPTYEFYQIYNGKKDMLGSGVSGVIEIDVLRNAKTNGYNNTYGCKAINSLGNSTEQHAIVNILVKPTGIALSPNVAIHHVNESSKVDIACSVSDSNPSAQFKWTKAGSLAFSRTSAMLSFPTVRRTDAGMYTCNASNAYGSITKSIDLVVQYGPEIINGSSITHKCLTSSVNIRCEATGVPLPFVHIIFAGISKKNGTGSAVYTINSIQAADLGNYTCMAKNALKEVNATRVLMKKAHPGAVTGVKLDKATVNSIEISWGLPAIVCTGSIKEIRIEYKESPAGTLKWMTLSGAVIKAKIVSLTAGKEYEITVIIVDRTNTKGLATPPLKAKTSLPPTKAPAATKSDAALIGGIAGAIMFLIILLVIFFVIRGNRRRRPSQAESGETGHIGAYGTTGTVEKKSNDFPLKDMDNGNGHDGQHYFGPDGKSIYSSVSVKDKNKTNAPGGVDNPKFVADSDGAYEPVMSITPKQSPAPKKKPEGNYAELSSFQVSGNAVTPESKPVKTEYATLEEVGPIINKGGETKPDSEEPETHKIVVSPEKEEDTADSDVAASKVDII